MPLGGQFYHFGVGYIQRQDRFGSGPYSMLAFSDEGMAVAYTATGFYAYDPRSGSEARLQISAYPTETTITDWRDNLTGLFLTSNYQNGSRTLSHYSPEYGYRRLSSSLLSGFEGAIQDGKLSNDGYLTLGIGPRTMLLEPVPEPATLTALALGLLALAKLPRRA